MLLYCCAKFLFLKLNFFEHGKSSVFASAVRYDSILFTVINLQGRENAFELFCVHVNFLLILDRRIFLNDVLFFILKIK